MRLVTVRVSRKISPTPNSETSVKTGLSETMAINTPTMVNPYVNNIVIELEIVVLILSTSLVSRLISSPC